MTEDQKKEVAVFRFGVIGEFVTGAHLDYGEKETAVTAEVRPQMVHSPHRQDQAFKKHHLRMGQAI